MTTTQKSEKNVNQKLEKTSVKQKITKEKISEAPLDPYGIIKHPLSTEKSIRLMESENKLIFAVEIRAKKPEIKQAIEKLFNCKVEHVNTFIVNGGEKRAYIRFSAETPAIDIATNLGLM